MGFILSTMKLICSSRSTPQLLGAAKDAVPAHVLGKILSFILRRTERGVTSSRLLEGRTKATARMNPDNSFSRVIGTSSWGIKVVQAMVERASLASLNWREI